MNFLATVPVISSNLPLLLVLLVLLVLVIASNKRLTTNVIALFNGVIKPYLQHRRECLRIKSQVKIKKYEFQKGTKNKNN